MTTRRGSLVGSEALLTAIRGATSNAAFSSIRLAAHVLGAFVAGMVLRRWSPGHIDLLEAKLDAVGYGFFIPIFFVFSGMTLDVEAIIANPVPMLVFFAVMFVVRGPPALFRYRKGTA